MSTGAEGWGKSSFWVEVGFGMLADETEVIGQEEETHLLEDFLPDVFGPMGSDRIQHQSLPLNPVDYDVLMHADRSGSLAVCVTGTEELVESGLQGELVRCAAFS